MVRHRGPRRHSFISRGVSPASVGKNHQGAQTSLANQRINRLRVDGVEWTHQPRRMDRRPIRRRRRTHSRCASPSFFLHPFNNHSLSHISNWSGRTSRKQETATTTKSKAAWSPPTTITTTTACHVHHTRVPDERREAAVVTSYFSPALLLLREAIIYCCTALRFLWEEEEEAHTSTSTTTRGHFFVGKSNWELSITARRWWWGFCVAVCVCTKRNAVSAMVVLETTELQQQRKPKRVIFVRLLLLLRPTWDGFSRIHYNSIRVTCCSPSHEIEQRRPPCFSFS